MEEISSGWNFFSFGHEDATGFEKTFHPEGFCLTDGLRRSSVRLASL